jgi:hypothetical protein
MDHAQRAIIAHELLDKLRENVTIVVALSSCVDTVGSRHFPNGCAAR